MDKEKLKRVREIIINDITKSDIDLVDKLELVMSIYYFLSYNNYDDNVKLLSKQNNFKRMWESGKQGR